MSAEHPGKTGVLTPEQYIVEAQLETWDEFFGGQIPEIPPRLPEILRRARGEGFTFRLHILPNIVLNQDAEYPGWKVRPEPWFWEQIRTGGLPKDAAILSGDLLLVETIQKPDYDRGMQLYENDPLAPILAQGRREGIIKGPDRVPKTSRFAVSASKIEGYVAPKVAKLLGVNRLPGVVVRKPRAIEFNVLGNAFYPQWGQTSTWEWFEDRFERASRLYGGGSGRGGLAGIRSFHSANQIDDLGFRLLVVFPQSY